MVVKGYRINMLESSLYYELQVMRDGVHAERCLHGKQAADRPKPKSIYMWYRGCWQTVTDGTRKFNLEPNPFEEIWLIVKRQRSFGYIRSENQRIKEYDPTSMGWEYSDLREQIKLKDQIAMITWDITPRQQIEWSHWVMDQSIRHADACLLLYDSNNRASFEALKSLYELMSQPLSKEGLQPSKAIVVMATKWDLVGEEGPAIALEEARNFAHGIDASFIKGSAMTGDGLDEMVNEIIRRVKLHRSKTNKLGAEMLARESDSQKEPKKLARDSDTEKSKRHKKFGRFDRFKFWLSFH
jgi:GTPase SAR1 family protein